MRSEPSQILRVLHGKSLPNDLLIVLGHRSVTVVGGRRQARRIATSIHQMNEVRRLKWEQIVHRFVNHGRGVGAEVKFSAIPSAVDFGG